MASIPTPMDVTHRVTILTADGALNRDRLTVSEINRTARHAIVLRGWYMTAPETIAARLAPTGRK